MRKNRETIVARYINKNWLCGMLWRVSEKWHVEGNRLVSDVGEEIMFLPAKKGKKRRSGKG